LKSQPKHESVRSVCGEYCGRSHAVHWFSVRLASSYAYLHKYLLTSVQHAPILASMKMLTVRIPEELHKAFKLKCVSEGVDMGSVIAQLIESYVKESKPKRQK